MPQLQILNSVGYVRPLKTNKTDKDPLPPTGKILEILRVRNRFDMKAGDPHWSGGFRDLAFKVKVGFKVLFFDVSSCASQTVATLQRCTCRSPRQERRSLFLCMTSCLHAAVPLQWLQWGCRASHFTCGAGTAGATPPSRPSSASCRFTTK